MPVGDEVRPLQPKPPRGMPYTKAAEARSGEALTERQAERPLPPLWVAASKELTQQYLTRLAESEPGQGRSEDSPSSRPLASGGGVTQERGTRGRAGVPDRPKDARPLPPRPLPALPPPAAPTTAPRGDASRASSPAERDTWVAEPESARQVMQSLALHVGTFVRQGEASVDDQLRSAAKWISARSGPADREDLIREFAGAVATYVDTWKEEWEKVESKEPTDGRRADIQRQRDRLAPLSDPAVVVQRVRGEIRAVQRMAAAGAAARQRDRSSKTAHRTDNTGVAVPGPTRRPRVLKSR